MTVLEIIQRSRAGLLVLDDGTQAEYAVTVMAGVVQFYSRHAVHAPDWKKISSVDQRVFLSQRWEIWTDDNGRRFP